MAYMSQERKAQIAPVVKNILKKYGVKGSISAPGGDTLKLTIKSSAFDFIGNYNETMLNKPYGLPSYWQPAKDSFEVNRYWYQEQFTGKVLNFFEEIVEAMNKGNWDRSDSQTDYFDVGWYVRISVGKWNKPYVVE